MLVGYARVSSVGQSLEVQEEQLAAAGCEKIFSEKQSGRSAADRPKLQEALDFVREGDAFVVTRLDRLARSVPDLWQIVNRLQDKGAGFRCLHQSIDTTRAEGRLFLTILGGFAEWEADLRAERQADGIAKAKAEGRYKGRPPKIDTASIRALRDGGKKPPEIASELGISLASVYRALPQRSPRGDLSAAAGGS